VAKRAVASTQELRDPRGTCSTAGRPVQQINECSQSGWRADRMVPGFVNKIRVLVRVVLGSEL